MEPEIGNLIQLQSKTKTFRNENLTALFEDRKFYLHGFKLFVTYFNTIPNYITEINIDCKRANHWFVEAYKSEIKDVYFVKRHMGQNKKAEFDDIFYILFDDLILYFDTHTEKARFLFRNTNFEKIEPIIKAVKKFQNKIYKGKPKISLLVNTATGVGTNSITISKPKLRLDYNYNDDFKDIHQTIKRRLSKKDDKGLILLHGKPGTGKTSYIRYLISSVRKQVIFLPPNMASCITNPELISILIQNRNSIFVIEDAENIVIDREKEGNSPVSALLNISDGLLSDCLSIQIICSFNTDISKVDSALLRKGRLIAKYEFKELEIDKAKSLSKKLGFQSTINSPMTLSAIYNQDEKDFNQIKKRNVVGFKAIINN